VSSAEDTPALELRVGNIAGGGGCVARDADGRVVFVRHALPGELVRAQVTSATSNYRRADAVEILEPSSDRVTPRCPRAGPGKCGGCDFQHVSLEAQRQLKAFRIAEQLKRIARIERAVDVEGVEGDEGGLGWRTRMRFAIDDQGRAGFRRFRSHEVVPIDHCPIAHEGVLKSGALAGRWRGASQVEVMADGNSSVVSIDAKSRGFKMPEGLRGGIVLNGRVVHKPKSVRVVVKDMPFRISAGVFWQVHAGAAAALAEAVAEVLEPRPGDSVVDLYAGAGLFAVTLAPVVGSGGTVLAVERDQMACSDARHNARGLPQLRVLRAAVTPALVEGGIGQPDLLVLDPAREGAGTAVSAALAAQHPQLRRMAYVSCDAGSFSRDLLVLLEAGWTLSSLRAFDIFPMTEHVELVAGLEPPRSGAPLPRS
jgi:tRNA/tmRNA/rRNA uracil-C5-methylase (TrmA/RlmC/RlmD family)